MFYLPYFHRNYRNYVKQLDQPELQLRVSEREYHNGQYDGFLVAENSEPYNLKNVNDGTGKWFAKTKQFFKYFINKYNPFCVWVTLMLVLAPIIMPLIYLVIIALEPTYFDRPYCNR